MADVGDSSNRPSFAGFWKKSKETLGVGRIRFVESTSGQGAGSEGGAQDAVSETTTDKAQLRRAQVRKAQTQHRQRKANYVKKLEMDVARIRDMIEATERDTHDLLKENKAMRARIQQAVNNKSLPLSLDQGVSLLKRMPEPVQLSNDTQQCLQEADNVTVTLGFDEAINAPTFYISSLPPSTHPSQPSESPQEASPAPDALPDLTPAQTQAAINFILALEHMCRWHFHPSYYTPPPADTFYPAPLIGPEGNGHTLMATSLALRNAPDHIFKAAWRSTVIPRFFSSTTSTPIRPIVGSSLTHPPTNPNPNPNPNQAPLPAHPVTVNGTRNEDTENTLSWQTTALTLRSLHGLASSLNPDDEVEVTPVQAWFELVRRFGVERLMAEGVLGRLKKGLVGVVRCPRMGCCLPRGGFEGVVARVLGEEVSLTEVT